MQWENEFFSYFIALEQTCIPELLESCQKEKNTNRRELFHFSWKTNKFSFREFQYFPFVDEEGCCFEENLILLLFELYFPISVLCLSIFQLKENYEPAKKQKRKLMENNKKKLFVLLLFTMCKNYVGCLLSLLNIRFFLFGKLKNSNHATE